MGSFHFFTDLDLLDSQSSTDAFGPLAAAGGKDRYQLTSLHSATSDPKAYAVCDGVVFIQEDSTNTDLVNLILKPMSQPPFAFPKVKFFIYHGIKKDSLIDDTNIASRTYNDLTESIWASQDARNASADTTDDPPSQALGTDIIDPTFPDPTPIEDIFYRTDVSYQFPVVRSGWSIGAFDSARFGFEIMMEAIGFDPPLSTVRNDKNILEVDTLSGSPTQPEEFEHWHDKEAILNYIDPAAFFGMFYHTKLKVKNSDDSTYKQKGNELYDELLIKFENKNITWLDIRNEYNFSFNYFKNYGTDIKVAFDNSSPLAIQNYYTSGWPILAIVNSSFPTDNTSSVVNITRISMPDGSGDNPLPLMYVSAGFLDSDYPREPKDKNKMIDLTVMSGDTDELRLGFPNRDDLSATTAITSYTKLKYFKRFDLETATPPESSGTVIRGGNFIDHLFAPYSMKIPFGGQANIKYFVYDEESYIDAKSNLNTDFIVSLGKSDNNLNFSFFTFSQITRKDESIVKIPFTISSGVDYSNKNILSVVAGKVKNKYVRRSRLVLPEGEIGFIELVSREGDIPTLKNSSTEEFFSIGFMKSSLASINISDFERKYRIYLGFKNETRSTDTLGQKYVQFDIALRGFELNGGVLQFKELVTDFKIFHYGSNI